MNTKPKQFTLYFDGQDGGRYIKPLSEHIKNHVDDNFIDVVEKDAYNLAIKTLIEVWVEGDNHNADLYDVLKKLGAI